MDQPLFYVAVGVMAFVVGLSKGGLGGAIVVAVTPLLALTIPGPDSARTAIGIALPCLLFGDVIALSTYWKQWRGDVIRALLPGAAVGVIIGSLLLPILSNKAISTIIGIMVWAYILYRVVEPKLRANLEQTSSPRAWHPIVFGIGSGFASTLANAGGPIVNIYFLMRKLSPLDFIATSALYFFILNAAKIPIYLSTNVLHVETILRIVWAFPLVIVGVWVGKRLITRMPQRAFETMILTFLGVAAVFLFLR